MKKFRPFALLLLILAPSWLAAQSHDFGGLLKLSFEQRIVKDFDFKLETEGRFCHNFTSFERLKVGGSFDYSFLKKNRLKLSLGANYLLYNDLGTAEHRGRVMGCLTYTEKFGAFKLSYRVRVQATFYDESRGDFKVNPKTYLRNRLQFSYDFAGKNMGIYASTEFFLRLYQKCFVDQFRTVLGWDYKLSKGHKIGFFLRADNEIQVKMPENVYYIGFAYTFKN